jgi:hypothetical protein
MMTCEYYLDSRRVAISILKIKCAFIYFTVAPAFEAVAVIIQYQMDNGTPIFDV